MKSDIEIAKFVYHAIKSSVLFSSVNGKLSDRCRPNNSEKEDIVISVLANEGCGQIQNAFVNVNIYIKDTYNSQTKSWEQSTQRIGVLCELSKFLFSIRNDEMYVVPKNSKQKVNPAGVVFEDGHTEHYINNKLFVEICNE